MGHPVDMFQKLGTADVVARANLHFAISEVHLAIWMGKWKFIHFPWKLPVSHNFLRAHVMVTALSYKVVWLQFGIKFLGCLRRLKIIQIYFLKNLNENEIKLHMSRGRLCF